jgi:hypothetical protein
MRGKLNGATMTDEQAPEPHTDEPEPAPEPRTLEQLMRAGYIGFLKGSDRLLAIIDPIMPDDPEEAEKLKWRFDF